MRNSVIWAVILLVIGLNLTSAGIYYYKINFVDKTANAKVEDYALVGHEFMNENLYYSFKEIDANEPFLDGFNDDGKYKINKCLKWFVSMQDLTRRDKIECNFLIGRTFKNMQGLGYFETHKDLYYTFAMATMHYLYYVNLTRR